ncbi:11825_t:CDS:2, partial [Scutellospora calospora]
LCKNGVSDEVIDATKDHHITEELNRLQKIRQKILTHQKLDSPNYFMSEAILKRLQGYSISYCPTEQALVNIITILCIHSAEVMTLYIANRHMTGYAKGCRIIQKVIANSTLWDPRILDIKWFNLFLKPYGIKLSDLHELDANYTAMIHESENSGQRFIIMREALRHNPRYVSLVEYYSRVPYRAIR